LEVLRLLAGLNCRSSGDSVDDSEANADCDAHHKAFGEALDKGAVALLKPRWRGPQGHCNVVESPFHSSTIDRKLEPVNPPSTGGKTAMAEDDAQKERNEAGARVVRAALELSHALQAAAQKGVHFDIQVDELVIAGIKNKQVVARLLL
jgi:hypothetical protein